LNLQQTSHALPKSILVFSITN